MSKLFVDEIVHQSSQGSGTITLGASGETVALASGASQTMAVNTPAFMVKLSSAQNITTGTWTKITFDSEVYDTNNAFASNKFTPGVAGKYKFELQVTIDDLTDQKNLYLKIYKNGIAEDTSITRVRASGTEKTTSWCNWSDIADSDDYYEAYVFHDIGSTQELRNDYSTIWMGYKIIE